MHTLHPFTANILERESRLLRFGNMEIPQTQAAERLQASRESLNNPDIAKAMALYDNPEFRARHPVLQNPLDRGYFYALLVNQTLDPGADYKTATRANLHPADPRGVVDPIDPADPLSLEAAGKRLLEFSNSKRLTTLDPAGPVAGPRAVGTAFNQKRDAAIDDWNVDQPLKDTVALDATVDYYVNCRAKLDAVLKKHNIYVPQEQSIDPGLLFRRMGKTGPVTDQNLQRDEYLALLTRVWNDNAVLEELDTLAPKTPDAVREKFVTPPDADAQRTTEIYGERAFEELGPSETLDRFGVTLGPQLQAKYVEARKANPDFQAADIWAIQPVHALTFLDQQLPKTEGNQKFLKGLSSYVDPSKPMPEELDVAGNKVKMDDKDVKAMLSLVSEACLEYETVVQRSNAQRERFMVSRGINLDGTLEKTGADVWKFMLDFRKHPMASGILWLGAAAAAKITWDMLTAPRARWSRWLFMGAMGAVGYGLYQKHKTGSSWFDQFKKKVDDFTEADKRKSPEEQTFANYWTDKLGLRDQLFANNHPFAKKNHAEAVFVTLQDQDVHSTLKWYNEARMNKGQGQKLPDLPPGFNVNPKTNKRYREMFGEMKKDERAGLFYDVLERFFEERGQYVVDHHMEDMYTKGGALNLAQVGFAYIRDKYDSQMMYEVVATQFYEKYRIEFEATGGAKITVEDFNNPNILNDPRILDLKKAKPEAYVEFKKILEGFRPVTQTLDTANWDMMTMMFQESNHEILRRNSREAAALRKEMDDEVAGLPK